MGLFSSLFGGNADNGNGNGGSAAAPKGGALNMAPLLKGSCGFNAAQAQDMSTLVARDPALKPGDVSEKANNWYMRLMDCWSVKNLEPMQPLLSPELYARFDAQLGAIKAAGYSNYLDNPVILNSNIDGWCEDAGLEKICLTMSTRVIDTTYDSAERCIAGTPGLETFLRVRVCLCRPAGTLTKQAGAISTVNCPNCAAALQINKTSVCPYCGGVVNVNASDWVICGIQELDRRS